MRARSAKILNFENLIPRELFTFQGPPLLKSDTGLFMDLKITLVSSQTSRVLQEAVSLQPPAFLKFFKKIKSWQDQKEQQMFTVYLSVHYQQVQLCSAWAQDQYIVALISSEITTSNRLLKILM